MKIFSFLYFNSYRFMQRNYPEDDPHSATLDDISMSLGAFGDY